MPWTFNIRTVLPKKARKKSRQSRNSRRTCCGHSGKAARLGYGESFISVNRRLRFDSYQIVLLKAWQGSRGGQLLHLHKRSLSLSLLLTALQGLTTSETTWFEGWSYQFISFFPLQCCIQQRNGAKKKSNWRVRTALMLGFSHVGLNSR